MAKRWTLTSRVCSALARREYCCVHFECVPHSRTQTARHQTPAVRLSVIRTRAVHRSSVSQPFKMVITTFISLSFMDTPGFLLEFGVFYTELKTPERSTLAPAIDVDRSSIESKTILRQCQLILSWKFLFFQDDDPPERANSQLTVKHLPLVNTTILQTVPSSNYPDKETDEWKNSPLLIPRPSMNLNSYNKQQYLSELLDGFGKRNLPPSLSNHSHHHFVYG